MERKAPKTAVQENQFLESAENKEQEAFKQEEEVRQQDQVKDEDSAENQDPVKDEDSAENQDPVREEEEAKPEKSVMDEKTIEGEESANQEDAKQEEPLQEPEPPKPEEPLQESGKQAAPVKKQDSMQKEAEVKPEEPPKPEEPLQEPEPAKQEAPVENLEAGKHEEPTQSFVDFAKLSKEELIEKLKELLKLPIEEIKGRDIDSIKINFYKKRKAEVEALKKSFEQEGGEIIDFAPQPEPLEDELKNYLQQYRNKKSEKNKRIEAEKEENLRNKDDIIEEIKGLVQKDESFNKTFQEFRALQKKWWETGPVPPQHVNDIWETYHYHVEKFYDYIKINQELRDLDLRKNLEAKIKLCEKAEELLIEPSILKAYDELQKLHVQWREIGPVAKEQKEPVWDRFKNATRIVNKRHHEYFDQLKNTQKLNLEAKTALCEQVEGINSMEIANHNDWEKHSSTIKEIQGVWKSIGPAPRKMNASIYKRFRNACDDFFNRKREYYTKHKEIQNANLQLKTDLCKQAEALQDSTDWKKTTDDLIQLQKTWKETGPVPHHKSEEIWKRFRKACDHFFKRKKDHFSNIDKEYEHNLAKKEALINEILEFKPSSNMQENLSKLKDFQKRWSEIGFVPIKQKDKIRNKYREAINKHFDNLQMDDDKKNVMKFKNKMETLQKSPNQNNRLIKERDKFINKMKKLENDIALWENNMGFFTKTTENADSMIEEVQNKIENAKKQIQVLEEKINMIDNTVD